jgi:hypothetical protein
MTYGNVKMLKMKVVDEENYRIFFDFKFSEIVFKNEISSKSGISQISIPKVALSLVYDSKLLHIIHSPCSCCCIHLFPHTYTQQIIQIAF